MIFCLGAMMVSLGSVCLCDEFMYWIWSGEFKRCFLDMCSCESGGCFVPERLTLLPAFLTRLHYLTG